MNVIPDLPAWAVVLLGLLAAAILVALNIGWLLSAKALLDTQRRKRGDTSPAETRPSERDSA